MIPPYRVVWRRQDGLLIDQRVSIPTFARAEEIREGLLRRHRGLAEEFLILDGAGIPMPASRPRKTPKPHTP